jgi:nicotinamidase/pyrazinamidase
MSKKIYLIVIDPQRDFCSPNGKLYVPGADKDMDRLSCMIKRIRGDLNDIVCTLDSHRTIHIAHPIWWINSKGEHPKPFTEIKEDDVTGKNPKWSATNIGYNPRSIEYVKKLKANNRYTLTIWPPHCLIGSEGYGVYPALFDSFCEWENDFKVINYVTKGSNMFTEHYSAVQADVIDPEDPGTALNDNLIQMLQDPGVDLIAACGEAGSHCFPNTIRDIVDNFGKENLKKIVYLEDACSPVEGCDKLQEDFINEMVNDGMQISTTDKFLK